jgi:DNA-binding NarL/FixJ family response regulator
MTHRSSGFSEGKVMSFKPASRVLLAHEYGLFLHGARAALVVAETRRGDFVLRLARRFSPELVLLGDRMGGRSTLPVVAALRTSCRSTKIVVMADEPRISEKDAFLREGAQTVASGFVNADDLVHVVRLALTGTSRVALSEARVESATDDAGLTARELDVLRCLAPGLRNDAIARELGVTRNTVKYHLESIYSKLRVGNRMEAMRWAVKYRVGCEPLAGQLQAQAPTPTPTPTP